MTTLQDDDLCPRCGASMQTTHHPLCQDRDGTPTSLTDEEVRQALAAGVASLQGPITCWSCGAPLPEGGQVCEVCGEDQVPF